MTRKKRELSSDEKRLWRRVAEGVKARKPLPPAEPEPEDTKPAKPVSKATQQESVTNKASAPSRKAKSPPANRAGEKRVRRGHLEIGATFDLHGHTQTSGRAALMRFLHKAHARGDRTVIVVTGMGRGGEGVLKRALPEWLADGEVRHLIAGYAQAHQSHGGAGAFYVFLKRVDTPG